MTTIAFRGVLAAVLVALLPNGVLAQDNLDKYLAPAQITRLDWLLLRAQVESLSRDIQWDKEGLVRSVVLFAGADDQGAVVGMTVLVNKERFLGVPDHTVKNVLVDVVVGASKILASSIPEVDHRTNILAIFLSDAGGDNLAEYRRGIITLKR